MKIGDKVIVTNPDYAKITKGAVGTIVAEQIPDSQICMLLGVQKWFVEFENPKLNYAFFEKDLTLKESEVAEDE